MSNDTTDNNTKDTIQLPTKCAVVAYHDHCIDGFTSAYIAHKALSQRGAEVILLPMKYDDLSLAKLKKTLAENEVNQLHIVDFSLSVPLLKYISIEYPETIVTVLDHHKTAFERYLNIEVTKETSKELEGKDLSVRVAGAYVKLCLTKSGAGICWDYFFTGAARPELVNYVEDYDIWQFKYGLATKYINCYINTLVNRDIKAWTKLESQLDDPETKANILAQGRDLYNQHQAKVIELASTAYKFELNGIPCLAVDIDPSEYKYINDIGAALTERCGTFGVVISSNEVEYKYSLRSNGDVDVAKIAEEFGGGGHVSAAGFALTKLHRLHKYKLQEVK